MKKFRRILSGFLAAAMIMTQSVTADYSGDQTDTTTVTSAPSGESESSDTSSDETEAPAGDEPAGDETTGGESAGDETTGDETTAPEDGKTDEDGDKAETNGEDEDETELPSIFELVELTSSPDYVDRVNQLYPINDVLDSIVVEVSPEEMEKAIEGLSQHTFSSVNRGSTYNFSSNYLYSKMTPADKAIYDQLKQHCEDVLACNEDYTNIVEFTGGGTGKLIGYASIGSMDTNRARAIAEFLRYSNPQYYFLSNTIGLGGSQVSIYFYDVDGHDFSKASQRQAAQTALDSLTNTWMPQIMAAGNTLQRELKIRDLVADYITYDHYANDYAASVPAAQARLTFDQSLISSILNTNHLTVCAGYAMITAYFCNAAGISAFYVNSNNHAWNIVNLYNDYYELDLTWYDSDNGPTYYDDRWVNKSHSTFLKNDQQNAHVYKAHWSYTTLPACNRDTVLLPSLRITTPPDTTTFNYGSELDLTGGIITIYDADGETELQQINMADALSAGTLTVSGYDKNKLGSQTLTLTYNGQSTTLTVNVIVDPSDPPVTVTVGGVSTNYLDLQSALNAITAEGAYEITINHDQSYSTVTIPAKATSVSLTTSGNAVLKTNSITANANTELNVKTEEYSANQTGTDVYIAKDKTVTLGSNTSFRNVSYVNYYATGTTLLYGNNVSVENLTNVSNVYANAGGGLEISSSVNVTNFSGNMWLANTVTSATVGKVVGNSEFGLYIKADNTFFAPTISSVDDNVDISINVLNGSDELVDLSDGTVVLKTTSTFAWPEARTTINNQNTSGQALSAFQYDAKIKAEFKTALTVNVNGVKLDDYPNFDLAFAAMKNYQPANSSDPLNFELILNCDMDTNSFTLPTASQLRTSGKRTLNIRSNENGTVRNLTLRGYSSLSAGYELGFHDIRLIPLTSAGATQSAFAFNTTATGANLILERVFVSSQVDGYNNIPVNISAYADILLNGCFCEFRTITAAVGTSKLEVKGDGIGGIAVQTLSGNFDVVLGNTLYIQNEAKNIRTLSFDTDAAGHNSIEFVVFKNAIAKINTIEGVADERFIVGIEATDANSVDPSHFTLTNITGEKVNFSVRNQGNILLTLSSGTPVFTAATANTDFSGKIKFENKTSSGAELTAWTYGTQVRAEDASALTLTIDGVDTQYPSFEKLFEALPREKNAYITLNENVDASSFSLPKNLGATPPAYVVIKSADANHVKKLTLHGIATLSPAYNFAFKDIELDPRDTSGKSVTTFAVSGSGTLEFNNVSFTDANTVANLTTSGSIMDIAGNTCKLGTLTGGTNTILQVKGTSLQTVDSLSTFKAVYIASDLKVTNSITTVTNVETGEASLILDSTANATFTNLGWNRDGGAVHSPVNITLVKNDNKLPTLKATNVIDSVTLTVKDSAGNVIGVPVGTQLMTAANTNIDFTDKLTITNQTKTTDGTALHATKNGTKILASSAEAITVKRGDETLGKYPDFTEAFKVITPSTGNTHYEYYVILNEDVDTDTFTLPMLRYNDRTDYLYFESADPEHPNTLTLRGIDKLSVNYYLQFKNIDLAPLKSDGSKQPKFTITSSNIAAHFTMQNVTCDENTVIDISGGCWTLNGNNAVFGNVSCVELLIGTTDEEIQTVNVSSVLSLNTNLTVKTSLALSGRTGIRNTVKDHGSLIIEPTATATIDGSLNNDLVLLATTAENGAITKLPNVTVKFVTIDIDITVKDSATRNAINVPSGTKLWKTVSGSYNYTPYLKIQNKTENDGSLYATLVGSDIVADDGDGVELKVYDWFNTDKLITSSRYPSLALALRSVQYDMKNVIILHNDEMFDPSDLQSKGVYTLEITSAYDDGGNPGTTHTLDLNGKNTINAPYDITFNNVKFKSVGRYDNPVDTLTISTPYDLMAFGLSLAPENERTQVVFKTTGKDSWMGIGNMSFTPNIDGYRSDYGWFSALDDLTVKNISNIGGFEAGTEKTLTITGTVSGVGCIKSGFSDGSRDEDGLIVVYPGAVVTATGVSGAKINLVQAEDGSLPQFTAKNFYKGADNDGNITDVYNRFAVVNGNGDVINLVSGTEIFKASCSVSEFNDDYTNNIQIANKTSTNDQLKAYYYNSTVRAEFGAAVTLRAGNDEPRDFPSLELAYKALKANQTNTITFNRSYNAGTLTLPSITAIGTTGSLEFKSNNADTTLTLTNASLSIPYELRFRNLTIKPDNLNKFTLTSSKNLYLENVIIPETTKVDVNATSWTTDDGIVIENCDINFGTATGTSASLLYIISSSVNGSEDFDKITTFGSVHVRTAKVTVNNITGVKDLKSELVGAFILPVDAKATVTNLGTLQSPVEITLMANVDGNGAITKIADLTTSTVRNATFTVNTTGARIKDGEKLFTMTGCSESTFYQSGYSGQIRINNLNTDGKQINAFYYPNGYNKGDIKAEYAGALTLVIDNDEGGKQNFPNFELAFKATQPNKYNLIKVNESVNAPKFVLPSLGTNGTLHILGVVDQTTDEKPTLTLNGIDTLSPGYNFKLDLLKFVPLAAGSTEQVPSFTINGSKSVELNNVKCDTSTKLNISVGANSPLRLSGAAAKFGTLSGTATSSLTINDSIISAEKVTRFNYVILNYDLTVTESITEVPILYSDGGKLILPAVTSAGKPVTATIDTLGVIFGTIERSGVIVLNADVDENGAITKIADLTVKQIAKANITVGDGTTKIRDGEKLFTMSCSESAFYQGGYSGKITIVNKNTDDKAINAFYYPNGYNKGDIKAEYAGVLTLYEGETEIGKYPNFTLAFKAMSSGTAAAPKSYKLVVNENITTTTFAFPSLNAKDSLEITGATGEKTVTFKNIPKINSTFNLTFKGITIDPQKADGNEAETFDIASTASLTLDGVTINNNCYINASAGSSSTLTVKSFTGNLNELKGTSSTTLELATNSDINKISTFAAVNVGFYRVTVNESITGVTKLATNEDLYIASTATATITTIDRAKVGLLADTSGTSPVIPKLNVTTINNNSTVTVYNEDVKDEHGNYEKLTLASGTPIFRCTDNETNFYRNSAGAFTIGNTDADGKKLYAYYYGGEIRAEVTGEPAVTLTVQTRNGDFISTDFTTLDKALNAAKKDCTNTITLKKSLEVSSIALPSGLGSGGITITADQTADTEPTLTFKGMTRLSAQCDIGFKNIELIFLDRSGNALDTFAISSTFGLYLNSVKTAAKLSLSSTGEVIVINGCEFAIGTISGNSSKTELIIGGNMTADAVNSFAYVSIGDGAFTVNTTLSSVSTLRTPQNGSLVLKPAVTATIGTIECLCEETGPDEVISYPANIVLCAEQNEDGSIKKLATLTVSTDITSVGGLKANVFVKNKDASALIPVPSGTKIFTFSGTEQKFNEISGNMQIVNTTTGDDSTKDTYAGKKLDPFYYSREIRAEYAGMLTLNGKNYPNFEKAFAAVEVNKINEITINEDINVPYGKFTLPTNLGTNGSLEIRSESENKKTLTLNGVTSLSPRYHFGLNNLKLVPLDRNGDKLTSFTISGSKIVTIGDVTIDPATTVNVSGTTLTIANGSNAKFGTLSGTTTSSDLTVTNTSITADKVTTFGIVTASHSITVNTSMTGVGELYGGVILPATATATITNLGYSSDGANITLLAETDENGNITKLAKPTITNVGGNSTFTVKKPVVNEGVTTYEAIPVPSGTPIFTFNGTEAQFEACKGNISITNKTATDESGKPLTPFYYSREIRAEYAGMLTLHDKNYPNFEKAFAAVEANKPNNIYINEDINVPYGKFTLPTNLGTNGSLNILCESSNKRTLTLNGVTSLSPRYDFMLNNVGLVLNDRYGNKLTSFTISGSKNVKIESVTCGTKMNVSVGAGSNLNLYNADAKFGTLSGTSTSNLIIRDSAKEADTVKTFGFVDLSSPLTVNSSVTGVAYVDADRTEGELILMPNATATITCLGYVSGHIGYHAYVTLLAETDANGNITKLPNLTVTNIAVDSSVTVKKAVVNNGVTTYEAIPVPSGTKIFTFSGGEAKFEKENYPTLTIKNGTEGIDGDGNPKGNPLTAWCYGSEVRAEWEDILTLNDGTDNRNYPSFEKVFKNVVPDKTNTIKVNGDIDAKVFTLPTNLKATDTLNIIGWDVSANAEASRTLTLHNITSLSPRYSFALDHVSLDLLDRYNKPMTTGKFTLSGSGNVTLDSVTIPEGITTDVTVGAKSALSLVNSNVNVGTLSGTATSTLHVTGAHTADKVATFGAMQLDSNFAVATSITGVTYLGTNDSAALILKDKATATITNLGIADTASTTIPGADSTYYRCANIIFADDDADGIKIAKLSAANIIKPTKFAVRENTGLNEIALPSGTPIFTYSGGEAKFETDDIKALITIVNKTTLDVTTAKPLTAWCYGSTVKAEYANAIHLQCTTEGETPTEKNFPSFVKMFKFISGEVSQRREHEYIVSIRTDLTADAFAIPTSYTTKFSIIGENQNYTITLGTGVTSISASCELDITNVTFDIKGRSLGITGSKNITLNNVKTAEGCAVKPTVTANGDSLRIENVFEGFASLSGRNTTTLEAVSSFTIDTISGFGIVNPYETVTVNKSISANELGYMNGDIKLADITTTATFTKVDAGSKITLKKGADARGNMKISPLTVTTADSNADHPFTVAIDDDYSTEELPTLDNATPIFTYRTSNADISEIVKIANKCTAPAGETLTPFVYGTEVRAEYADALSLYVYSLDRSHAELNKNYPTFEKAFAATQQDKINEITVNNNIDTKVFALPNSLGTKGSLEIKGVNGTINPTIITLRGISTLSPRYDFTLEDITLEPLTTAGAPVSTFTISGSKNVNIRDSKGYNDNTTFNFSTGAGSSLDVNTFKGTIGTLSGTSTSNLYLVASECDKIATFAKVIASGDDSKVKTSITGVTTLYTNNISSPTHLVLAPTATVTVTNLGGTFTDDQGIDHDFGADLILLAQTDANGNITKLPNLTVTNIVIDSSITVKNADGTAAIPVPSGTKLFKLNCGQAKFEAAGYPTLTIKNGTEGINDEGEPKGKPLTAYLYGSDLKAEYADLLTLRIIGNGTETSDNYPNFEKAFAAVKPGFKNEITLNGDVDATVFTLPTNLKATDTLKIRGDSPTENRKLRLHNVSTSTLAARYNFSLWYIELECVDRNNNPVNNTVSISTSGQDLDIRNLTSANTVDAKNTYSGEGGDITIQSPATKFGTISGTSKCELYLSENTTAQNVTTFYGITMDNGKTLTVSNSISGIGTSGTNMGLAGTLKLEKTATANITNVDVGMIKLVYDDTKKTVPKVTVNTIAEHMLVEVIDETGAPIALTSGTPVLYAGTNTDITGKITISPTNGTFEPVLYTREIRAETPNVITLEVGTITETFTSFEKLFQRITTLANTDRTNQNNYVVTISGDLETKIFNLPYYGKGFTVKSAEGTNHKLVLKGISISYKNYPVNFDDVDVTFVPAA